ncbi:MAG: HDIG domain-containing protein [Bacteroidales bacterium]|nr:HDIG domain-containing protein [Bacteroidales bacterium]
MNALDIIRHFYPEDTPLRRLLIQHSSQVRDKALSILANPVLNGLDINVQLVNDGAMLHDIGIVMCDAPSIHCEGTEPYLLHGTIGARMLREFGAENGVDLEAYARICERHTGAGLTREDIIGQDLPLPHDRDLLPETLEEKLVCLADKFYSKSSPDKEKPMERVLASMRKFGTGTVERFAELCDTFSVPLGNS